MTTPKWEVPAAPAQALANLQHPHILGLHDSGDADGLLFYAMPYIDGESLRDRLEREHQLSVDDAVRIATNLAEALDYAHRQGVIHRDIKPANVLLQDGKPAISDFGIALAVDAAGGGRLTETGLSLGTPHYMSPEQATGDLNVGPATDIYALGERSSVPSHVDAVIRQALAKVPADRFRDSTSLIRALGDPGFRYGEVTSATEAGMASGPSRGLLLALAITVLYGGGTTWVLFSSDDPEPVARAIVNVEAAEDHGLALSPDGQLLIVAEPHSLPGEPIGLLARPLGSLTSTGGTTLSLR